MWKWERGSWTPHLIRNFSDFLMVKYAMLVMNKTYSTLNILTSNLKHLPHTPQTIRTLSRIRLRRITKVPSDTSLIEWDYLLKRVAACLNCKFTFTCKFGERHQTWWRNAENLGKCFSVCREKKNVNTLIICCVKTRTCETETDTSFIFCQKKLGPSVVTVKKKKNNKRSSVSVLQL